MRQFALPLCAAVLLTLAGWSIVATQGRAADQRQAALHLQRAEASLHELSALGWRTLGTRFRAIPGRAATIYQRLKSEIAAAHRLDPGSAEIARVQQAMADSDRLALTMLALERRGKRSAAIALGASSLQNRVPTAIALLHAAGSDQVADARRAEDRANLFSVFVALFVLFVAGLGFRRLGRARRELGLAHRRLRALVQNTADLILVLDGRMKITFATERSASLLGWTPEELQGRPFRSLLHSGLAELARAGHGRVQAVLLARDGEEIAAELLVADLRDDPAVAGIVVTVHDQRERRRLEFELRRRALEDPLTGLANRVLFGDRLQLALDGSRAQDGEVGVLYLDLDGFKLINDRFGHDAGDRVLRCVAERLRHAIRGGDLAARLGGDEFAVLLPSVANAAEAEAVAARVRGAMQRPISVEGESIVARASVGVALGQRGTTTADALLRAADVAMYDEKIEASAAPREDAGPVPG